MYIINQLEFEKEKHTSTRLIKTFPNECKKNAVKYLEDCLALNMYVPKDIHTKYELRKI